MALDSKLTQTINLRANGDQLLRPLEAFGNKLNRLTKEIEKVANPSTKKGQAELAKLTREFEKLARHAKTIQDIINNGSVSGRRRNALFAGLDEQALGKKTLSASKLKQELATTTSAATALEIRLAQINKEFAKLGNAGRTLGKRDISKALGTEEALKQVRRLEQEISKLDSRAQARGGLTGAGASLRAELQRSQDTLLGQVKGGRRVNFSGEIGQLTNLVAKYRELTKAQETSGDAAVRAATKRRQAALETLNMNEGQLRALVNRGATSRFTPDQARGFNMRAINDQVEQGTQRLMQFQAAMSKAMAQGRSQGLIDRLAQSFENLKIKVSEATAMQRAFNSLPEQRMRNLTSSLFADGGAAFGARILGAGALATGAFAVIGGIQNSLGQIVKLEDALAKLQAIAGATDQQMASLGKSIVDVSTNTRYSVVEITEAATQIAQAGFSASETATILKDSLTLATASGASPAEAVDTMTSSLGAFQLQAGESTRVTDTLVAGLNRSKLSIQQMQQAIQYAGATAKENNVRFEELVAISASLANAGIRSGSTIGTGLRQMLVDLKTPTEKFKKELEGLGLTLADVDVKTLGFAEVVKRLTEAGFSAEAAYESFEVRAAASFLAFKSQIKVYDQLALSISRVGAAQEANDRAMDTVAAKWQKLLNVLSQLVTTLASPVMSALKTVLDGLSLLVGVFTSAGAAVGSFTGAMGLLAVAFKLNPFVGVITSLVTIIGLMRDASDRSEELRSKTLEAEAAFDSQQDTVSAVDEAINGLITREEVLTKNKVQLATETVTLTQRFEGLSLQLGGAATSYDQLLKAMLRYRGEALKQAALTAKDLRLAAESEREALKPQLAGSMTSFRGLNFTGGLAKQAADLGSRNLGVGIGPQNEIQAMALRLKEMKSDNSGIQALIRLLEQRLDLMRRADALNAQISQSNTIEGLYNERASQAGQARDGYVLDAQRGIDIGLRDNKENPGSATKSLDQTLLTARRRITALRNQLATLTDPNSPRYMAIESSINELEAQVARVTRASRIESEAADKIKPERAGAGETLTAAQVKAELIRKWPQIASAISFARQRKPGDYGYKPNSYHSKPGGQAIDIDESLLPKDITWDQIARAIEGMGLELAEAGMGTMGRPGVKKVPINHGSAPHGHFSWKSKTSQFQQQQDSAAQAEARELQRLTEMQADGEVAREKDEISSVIAQAKAGTGALPDMKARLEQNLKEYRDVRLAAFDAANPTDGISDTQKQIITQSRATLEKEINAETATLWENFNRAILDAAGKSLDTAMAAAENNFEQAQWENGAGSRAAESNLASLGNRKNRDRFGEGTQYRMEREAENATFAQDRADLVAIQAMIASQSAAVTAFQQQMDGLVQGSEAYTVALQQRDGALAKLNGSLRTQAELQQQVNERERELANIPIKQRLEDSAQSWLANSGAMDSWAKQAENAVGPLLDHLTTGFANFFTEVASGTKSVKAALGDLLKNFASFVLQMIAKALALAAVKAILKAIGVDMPTSSYNGGEVKSNNADSARAFNGGPVEERYSGGYIDRGVSNRDSALYNLAQGEYVIRNKSVRDIGIKGMEMINKHGAKGLDKIAGAGGGMMQNIQVPRQETNVYVVQERGAPPMGPGDVLVTIQEDILQGGTTKKLIRQVSQGG